MFNLANLKNNIPMLVIVFFIIIFGVMVLSKTFTGLASVFGFNQVENAKVKVGVQEEQIKKITDENSGLVDSIEKIKKSQEVTIEVIETVIVKEKARTKKIADILKMLEEETPPKRKSLSKYTQPPMESVVSWVPLENVYSDVGITYFDNEEHDVLTVDKKLYEDTGRLDIMALWVVYNMVVIKDVK